MWVTWRSWPVLGGGKKKNKKTEEEMSERGRLGGHVMDLFGERVHVGDSEP